MKTPTRTDIVTYIQSKGYVRVRDIIRFFGLTPAAVHRQLSRLIRDGVVTKTGKPPVVYYSIPTKESTPDFRTLHIAADEKQCIDENFLHITSEGIFQYGLEGFAHWARLYQPKEDMRTLSRQYVSVVKEKAQRTREGWIDATEKMTGTFHPSYVDRLLYADVYSYPVFGRTKLAKLVMHAKQSGDRELIRTITLSVASVIASVISGFQIQAVGFIPPTVPRPVQFMDEFEKMLKLPIPAISISKVIPGRIPIPQKTLPQLRDRVANARASIFPDGPGRYTRILLIDDVAGSGASFQETACKLKARGFGRKTIVAFAIIGSRKGYDVIREM